MIKRVFIFVVFLSVKIGFFAQTDFPALKQQFLDYRKSDKQDSALFIARKMSQLALKEQTDTSYWYALSMRYQGNPYETWGNKDSTIFYWSKSVDLFKKYHPVSSDYVLSMKSLGSLYFEKQDYELSEKYNEQALEITYAVSGEDNPLQVSLLIALGNINNIVEDYRKSEMYYSRALRICIKMSYDKEQAAIKIGLGELYRKLGDYSNARKLYLESLDWNKVNYSTENLQTARIYNNLGVLSTIEAKYNEADFYFKKVLKIRQTLLGVEHIEYAKILNNIGDLYRFKGLLDSAFTFYSNSLGIKLKTVGENNLSYSQNLFDIAELYKYQGKMKESELFYIKALKIISSILGEEHSEYITKLNSYSFLLFVSNRENEAYDILSKNFKKKAIEITDNFEWLNDNQKEAYWKKESSIYDNLSWFTNEAHEKIPEAIGLNYNAALVTKSKMLEAKISSENYYREVDELREELAYRRRLLAKMESDGSTEKEKLDKLRKEADSLDKRLTLSWPEYAQQKKNLSITWDQVQQNLDKGEAAIEFIRYKNEDDSLYYYNALVLKKGDKNPTLVKLCKEKDIQAISPKMGYSAYYPLVWQPLEAALKDVKTIYYAPTGELYNVPFHAIYAPKGKGDEVLAAKTDKRGVIIQNERAATEQNAEYLMDRYTMHQLTSTRYLAMGIKQKAKEPIGNTMAMVGGVNYVYLPGSTAAPKKNKKDKNASRSSASASGKLNYLEGTKTEVEQINHQVTASTWQTKLIENNEAIEENITKLEGKEAKGILHIATHGYAFPEYDFSDTSISKNSLRYSYRYSTNPMVRSGLILAGGNWAWTGSDTLSKLGAEQNGILTALEVSQLNLKKTKLVVLSACETGLGKIEGSEGTFGLKRGFKLAGVEQMIVSLWSVPDKETMELMTLFYSDLTKTLNPVLSFENAQKEMRTKYPTDPEKWAGFVLVR